MGLIILVIELIQGSYVLFLFNFPLGAYNVILYYDANNRYVTKGYKMTAFFREDYQNYTKTSKMIFRKLVIYAVLVVIFFFKYIDIILDSCSH